MFRVHVIVREAGGLKPEYGLDFDLPELPRVGSYISVQQSGDRSGKTEDLIVRQVWWRVAHPDRDAPRAPYPPTTTGYMSGVVVECAKALGPNSTSSWKEELLAAERAGFEVETFDVEQRPGGYMFGPPQPVSKSAVRRGPHRPRAVASELNGRVESRRRQH